MANIKSQIKRIQTNEKRRLRNKSVKSSLKTAIRTARSAVVAGALRPDTPTAPVPEEQRRRGAAGAG